jgi:hypothetical protein
MRIYNYTFRGTVPYDFVKALEDKDYQILVWCEGKLIIVSGESWGKLKKIGELISGIVGGTVLIVSCPVNVVSVSSEVRISSTIAEHEIP